MDFKIILAVFTAIFLAELGDKTQLATMIFSADHSSNKLSVFLGSSSALILTSAIGVFFGSIICEYISPKYMSLLAGIFFILIGCWSLYKALYVP